MVYTSKYMLYGTILKMKIILHLWLYPGKYKSTIEWHDSDDWKNYYEY